MLFLAGAVHAQPVSSPAGGLSLAAALAQAEAIAPELTLSRAGIDRALAEQSGAAILPHTNFFVGADNMPALGGEPGSKETTFGVVQAFQLPGYYRARRRAAHARVGQATVEHEALRRNVRLQVTQAYLEAMAARDLLVLADSGLAMARRYVAESVRREELGQAGPLETLQAQVALAEVEGQRAQAAGRATAAQAALRSRLGYAPGSPLSLTDSLTLGSDLPPLSVLEEHLMATSADLAAADAAIEVAETERRVVGAERMPDFAGELFVKSIAGVYGYLGGSFSIGIPIARILNRAPDRAAEEALHTAETQRDMIEGGIVDSLRSQVAALEAAREQARIYVSEVVPQANRAYGLTLRLRREGAANYLEVLGAQRVLLATQTTAVEKLLEVARLRAELKALTSVDL